MSKRRFEDYDWAPPDVDLDELVVRIHEIYEDPTDDPARALASWILKYWTLRFPDGGLPEA